MRATLPSHGRGKGKDWVEQMTTWRVETVKGIQRHPLAQIVLGAQRHPTRPDRLDSLWAQPRLSRRPTSRGGRADLRLAVTEPPTEQGLRTVMRHQRGVDLPGHDPPHAPQARSLLRRVFRQFLNYLPHEEPLDEHRHKDTLDHNAHDKRSRDVSAPLYCLRAALGRLWLAHRCLTTL